MTKVGIYLGLSGDEVSNVEKLIRTWKECTPNHSLEFFGGADPPQIPCSYVKISHPNYYDPFTKLLIGTLVCMRYIRTAGPDIIVQLVKFNTHATPVVLAGKITSTPTVVRLSGATYESYRGFTGLRRVFTYMLNRGINGTLPPLLSSKAIAFGQHSRDQLVNRGCDLSDIIILPPAGIEARFAPSEKKQDYRREIGIKSDRKVLLYVGRLTKLKGMPFLSSVIDQVIQAIDVRFLLVGDGPMRDKLNQKHGKYVLAPGRVPYSEIDRYYKAADLYVHPSQYEGIPLVILEALSTGLPVIARDAGDISSVTPNVVTSPDGMARKIINGDYSTEWLNQHRFTKEYQQKKLTELFEELAGSEC